MADRYGAPLDESWWNGVYARETALDYGVSVVGKHALNLYHDFEAYPLTRHLLSGKGQDIESRLDVLSPDSEVIVPIVGSLACELVCISVDQETLFSLTMADQTGKRARVIEPGDSLDPNDLLLIRAARASSRKEAVRTIWIEYFVGDTTLVNYHVTSQTNALWREREKNRRILGVSQAENEAVARLKKAWSRQ